MLVNVNPDASQWPTNLISYDALHRYGSPSYYVQQMFSHNHGDVVLPVTLTTPVSGLGRNFEYHFKPHSVTVLQIGPGGEHPDAAGNGDLESN